MKRLEIVCDNCDASFDIVHDLGAVYRLEFCAFCGELLFAGDDDMVMYEDDDYEIDEWD
jgi:hypothetical protein